MKKLLALERIKRVVSRLEGLLRSWMPRFIAGCCRSMRDERCGIRAICVGE